MRFMRRYQQRKLEVKRKRKLEQVAQKFGVIEALPEIVKKHWSYRERRLAINRARFQP